MVARLWQPIRGWLARHRWQRIRGWLARHRWWLAALAALAIVVLACVLVIPQWLVRWDLGGAKLADADRVNAINGVRTALLAAIAGTAALLGAYTTYRQFRIAHEQLQHTIQEQLTNRFGQAVDMLGKERSESRLNGIRLLERMARESPGDRGPIIDILLGYLRSYASWEDRGKLQPNGPRPHFLNWMGQAPEGWPAVKPETDVQYALRVLTSGLLGLNSDAGYLNFSELDLRGAQLQNGVLERAQLVDTHLTDALLSNARLVRANFRRAHLEGANLSQAQCCGADFYQAHLDYAFLYNADFTSARLNGIWLATTLTSSRLIGAHLQGVKFTGATLSGADFTDALLYDANLEDAVLERAHLEGADLSSAHLAGAIFTSATFDSRTRWPRDFEPEAQGAVRSDGAD